MVSFEAGTGFPFYQIFRQVTPKKDKGGFGVAETLMTIDGPRTRMVRMGFDSALEAEAWIEAQFNKFN